VTVAVAVGAHMVGSIRYTGDSDDAPLMQPVPGAPVSKGQDLVKQRAPATRVCTMRSHLARLYRAPVQVCESLRAGGQSARAVTRKRRRHVNRARPESSVSWDQGLSWACPGPVLGLSWACPGPVLGLSWACPGSVLGLSWACPGPVLGLSWACPGPVLGLSWACPGPVLGLSWACPGPVLGLSWACPGPVLGLSWACPGPVLGLSWVSGVQRMVRRACVLPLCLHVPRASLHMMP
jgi:hypothetical protein